MSRFIRDEHQEKRKYWYSSIDENIPFLQRMLDCINNKVSSEVREATVMQLETMIKELKKKIQVKEKNSLLNSRFINK